MQPESGHYGYQTFRDGYIWQIDSEGRISDRPGTESQQVCDLYDGMVDHFAVDD